MQPFYFTRPQRGGMVLIYRGLILGSGHGDCVAHVRACNARRVVNALYRRDMEAEYLRTRKAAAR